MFLKKQPQRIHHISSHFTNGLFPTASVCITFFLLTESVLFENAAFCCCGIGTLFAPVVYGSGMLDWRIRFNKRSAKIFTRKLVIGFSFVLVSSILMILRLSLGTETMTTGAMRYLYAGMIYVITCMVTYLGYLGGKFIV